MPRADLLRAAIATVFPSWSSQRMSRWLGVNPRTLQRWLAAGQGEIDESDIPPELADRITAMAHTISDTDFEKHLDHFLTQWKANGIDDEVMGAWLADRYARLIGREID